MYSVTAGFYGIISLLQLVDSAARYDNSVIGLPVISCEKDQIRIQVQTAKPFGGRIFVRGEYANKKCVRHYLDGKPTEFEHAAAANAEFKSSKFTGAFPDPTSPDGKYPDTTAQFANPGIQQGFIQPSPEIESVILGGSDSSKLSGASGSFSSSGSVHDGFAAAGTSTVSPLAPRLGARTSSEEMRLINQWLDPAGKIEEGSEDERLKNLEANRREYKETPDNRDGLNRIRPDSGNANQNTSQGDIKIFPKAKPTSSLSGTLPSEAGNCPLTCEPCSCASNPESRRRRDADSIELVVPISECSAKRDRQLSPPTVTISFVAQVSFHDSFITQFDRAYHIQCAYVETNKSVSTQMNVEGLKEADLNSTLGTEKCEYRIGGKSGGTHTFRVGDQVKHEWSCDSPKDLYSLLVHDCYAKDESGEQYAVIDEHGCSLDRIVLQTPTYSSDSVSASVEAYMLKFPDNSGIYFQCSIKMCVTSEEDCKKITPPRCDTPTRMRRSADRRKISDSMSIHSNTLTVLDVEDSEGKEPPIFDAQSPPPSPDLCLSIGAFGALVSFSTFLTTLSAAIIVVVLYLRSQPKY